MMASKLSLRELAEKILDDGKRLRRIEIVVHASDFPILRILSAGTVPALGAEDLRRSAGDAHAAGDLGLLTAEGLIEVLAL